MILLEKLNELLSHRDFIGIVNESKYTNEPTRWTAKIMKWNGCAMIRTEHTAPLENAVEWAYKELRNENN